MKPAVVHGLEGNPATQGISRSLDSRNVLAAFPLHVLLAAGYRFKIVTDPDDLSHAIQQALKVERCRNQHSDISARSGNTKTTEGCRFSRSTPTSLGVLGLWRPAHLRTLMRAWSTSRASMSVRL